MTQPIDEWSSEWIDERIVPLSSGKLTSVSGGQASSSSYSPLPTTEGQGSCSFCSFLGRFCPALSPLHWPNLSGTDCESLHTLSGWGETLTPFLFIVQRDFPSHHSWCQSQIDDDKTTSNTTTIVCNYMEQTPHCVVVVASSRKSGCAHFLAYSVGERNSFVWAVWVSYFTS